MNDWSDYEYDHAPAVAPRRPAAPNYVAPGPAAIVPRQVEILPPAQHELQHAQPVQTVQRLDTSAVDRAKGFTIVSVPLALALGIVALLVGIVAFGMPWLSLPALLLLFGMFTLAWLLAWLWHQSASPDGVALWQVLLHYRLLRHEQRARHGRMQEMSHHDH